MSSDRPTIDFPVELVPVAVAGTVPLLRKPKESKMAEGARALLTWVADADLDPVLVQLANYELASTATDKGEQLGRHALSAAGPGPERAAMSGLRGGVLALELGDADAAEALFTIASSNAAVETPNGVVIVEAGFWAATHLGALYIGQNRLREAASAYTIATASTNSGILAAARQGMQRIEQLSAVHSQAAEPPTVG